LDLATSRFEVTDFGFVSFERIVKEVTKQLLGEHPLFAFAIREAVAKLYEKAIISDSFTLNLTIDSPINCKEGFERKQLANYTDDNKLYIDRNLYDRMRIQIRLLFIHGSICL
jgi:hypothetical protein